MPDRPVPTLLDAVLAVQAEAPTLKKDATNPRFGSFTPLDTVVETIGPLLSKHGLVWRTSPTTNEHGQPALKYRLSHAESGETDEDVMPLLLGKADMQGLGSAITYARRYALCAVLNLVSDDDDDGNAAASAPSGRVSSTDKATDRQLSKLKGEITKNKPSDQTLRLMLAEVGADGVDPTKTGWSEALKKNQASGLIDRFVSGVLPTGESDIPSDIELLPADVDTSEVPWGEPAS